VALCETLGSSNDRIAGENKLSELLKLAGKVERPVDLGARAATLVLRDAAELDRSRLTKLLASNLGDVSRAFHRDNGITFREFRHRVRVLRFLETCSTMPNLTRAALLAGFGSYSQCHRVFSRVMGVSPRAYLGSELPGTQASLFEPLGPAQSIRCSPCAKEP
jgi:methylphosphotriester-DNA--protein-cysteine methyltransferase